MEKRLSSQLETVARLYARLGRLHTIQRIKGVFNMMGCGANACKNCVTSFDVVIMEDRFRPNSNSSEVALFQALKQHVCKLVPVRRAVSLHLDAVAFDFPHELSDLLLDPRRLLA